MALIETFCSGKRRLSLFGTPKEARRGWLTVGSEGSGLGDGEVYTPPDGVELFDANVWNERFPNNRSNLVPLTQEIDNLRPKSPTRSQGNSRNNTPKTAIRPPPTFGASPVNGMYAPHPASQSPPTPFAQHSPYTPYSPYAPSHRSAGSASTSTSTGNVNLPYNPQLNAQINRQMQAQAQAQMQWQVQMQVQMQLQMQAQAAHMQMFGGAGGANNLMNVPPIPPQPPQYHHQYSSSPSQSPPLNQRVYTLSPQPIALGFDRSRGDVASQQNHHARRPRYASSQSSKSGNR